jgi:ABC-type lipoprotein release transport system permease subunit
MTSVTFAVVLAILMQSLQKGTFGNLIRNVVGLHAGYVQVHKQGYWEEQVIENCFPSDERLVASVRQVADVRQVAPRIESYALASSGNLTRGCLVIGVDPVAEDGFTRLSSRLVDGRYMSGDGRSALIGDVLAERLGLKVDDTLVLLGQGYQGSLAAGKYPVVGILHSGSPQLNESVVYLPLPAAREFLGADGMLTALALDIADPGNLDRVLVELKARIPAGYEVMDWRQMMPEIDNHMKSDALGFYVWTGILYLIIAFGIFSTLLMMTAERRYEFGMLVAIGMKRSRISLMLFGESLLITVMGTLLGVLLALPVVWYFQWRPIRIGGTGATAFRQWGFEPILPTAIDPGIFLRQSLTVLVMACLIGLYPVWKAGRIDPLTSMKK